MEGMPTAEKPPEPPKPKSFVEQARINKLRGEEDLKAAEQAEAVGVDPMDVLQERALAEASERDVVEHAHDALNAARASEFEDAQREAAAVGGATATDMLHDRALKEDAEYVKVEKRNEQLEALKTSYELFFPNRDFTPKIISPKDIDYNERRRITKVEEQEFTLNPKTMDRDFGVANSDHREIQVALPGFDAATGSVLDMENYKEQLLPGIEYAKFLMENPDKIPESLKKVGVSFYLPGSVIKVNDGYLGLRMPFLEWNGSAIRYRTAFPTGKNDRLIVLKRKINREY